MQCDRKLKLRSHNTSYCLIEVVTKECLTVFVLIQYTILPMYYLFSEKCQITKYEFSADTSHILVWYCTDPSLILINLPLICYVFKVIRNILPWYNWNVVESGIKHHNRKPLEGRKWISALKDLPKWNLLKMCLFSVYCQTISVS